MNTMEWYYEFILYSENDTIAHLSDKPLSNNINTIVPFGIVLKRWFAIHILLKQIQYWIYMLNMILIILMMIPLLIASNNNYTFTNNKLNRVSNIDLHIIIIIIISLREYCNSYGVIVWFI